MEENRNENLQNQEVQTNDLEQQVVTENVATTPKKVSAFHLIFKIIIGIVYLLSTGYMLYLLANMFIEQGWAILGFVITLVYVVFAYLFNIAMSIIGLIKSKKEHQNGKTDKPVDKFYVISIIVNVLTYLVYWIVFFVLSIFS